ncbi:MAG TPA: hypothetical protein DCM87_20495 [Planctomycetes bacterium]|nr:hypothetical protein [Planctomycetota bacterium]
MRPAPGEESVRPRARHYTAGAAPRKAFKGGILGACAAALLAGCAAGDGFRTFTGHVSWHAKGAGGAWRPVSRAEIRGVAGPDYLRIESVQGAARAGRIFALARGECWEYGCDPNGRWSCNMYPGEEHSLRLEDKAEAARREARRTLAGLPVLTRQNLWPLFAGGARSIESLSNREEIHGHQARKVRAGAYPGAVWDVWVSAEFPLPAAQAALLLAALDLPLPAAHALIARLGETPVEIDALCADGKTRVRYSFTAVPVPAAAEDVAGVIPAECMEAIAARERRIASDRILLARMTGVGDREDGVTQLGAAVRYCARLDARRVQAVVRRVETVPDSIARRYLMRAALRASPGHAVEPLKALVRAGAFDVARDAAQALAEHLPPPDNVRVLLAILGRGVREDRDEEFRLWVNDILQAVTETDIGYWPDRSAGAAITRWLDAAKGRG